MKKDLVEMVFILDRSGSMGGLEDDTIGGYNSLLEKQKHVEGEAIISTVLFDDEFEVLHNRINIKDVKQITEKEYYVRGSTALLDAIGRSIRKIISVYRHLKDDELPEKTVFIITTDGMENASREFSYSRVKEMIELEKNRYNWEFIFLGSNIDAIAEAKKFGISHDRAVNYRADRVGTNLHYEVISDTLQDLRINKDINSNWKKRIDDDYKERK